MGEQIRPDECSPLTDLDFTNFRYASKDQKDFIHNLRIMDALYTDEVKQTKYLADFADDDFYARKILNYKSME